VSQFFSSNPAARPSQGPKRGPWRRDLPRTWQEAFGERALAPDEGPREPAPRAEGEAAGEPPGRTPSPASRGGS